MATVIEACLAFCVEGREIIIMGVLCANVNVWVNNEVLFMNHASTTKYAKRQAENMTAHKSAGQCHNRCSLILEA